MVLGGVIAALAVAVVVVGVIVLTGGKGGASASRTSTNSAASLAASRRAAASASTVRPATVTVSVLNGTDVLHLGHTVSDRLAADGYRQGSVANASIQQQASTIVAYMAPADRNDALAVAKSLKLTKAAVRLVDPATKATVCPTGQTCTTAVVVTVGQDLSQL